ncbi:MAG: 3-oxoacyl-[acyl-carrier protein] reductase, partial [Actinomycetota bacterium]|nr:3-oxoacyl-[acyl-carrier protein] reductase [Actinomycetota bacterium]
MTEPADFAARSGTALVAGGTGGLGSAIVRLLVARGSTVAFTYLSNAARAAELTAELGVQGRQVDLTDAAGVASYVAGLGDLHTVVYAAGPHVPMRHLSQVAPADMAAQLRHDA